MALRPAFTATIIRLSCSYDGETRKENRIVSPQFRNKTVLITGAAQGIGAAIAKRFAQEGAQVAIADIDDDMGKKAAVAIEKVGGKALYLRGDVSRPAEVRALIAGTVQHFGGLNILVNNAAYGHAGGKRAHEVPEAEWERVLAVCLTGPFLCARYAIPEML
jgi:NAD(P)-dependent dehydrogenase (short-subunit alcohol dehydrogenase family)